MIDDKVEDTFRELLDHAMHNRQDELGQAMLDAGEKVYQQVLVLCVQVSSYIAIDVSKRVPTEADFREIARAGSESRANLPVTESEQHAFLSQAAFGFRPLGEVFTDETRASIVPLFTTASLVLSFCPQDKSWSQFLDLIESALEAADQASLALLPSLTYRHLALTAQAGKKIRPSTA